MRNINVTGCLREVWQRIWVSEEKLDLAADGAVGSLVDANQLAPLQGRVDAVVHDLAGLELLLLLEDLFRSLGVVDVGVVHV